MPTIETGIYNHTRHEDGPPVTNTLDLGSRPAAVTYHGSNVDYRGPAWANWDTSICEDCTFYYQIRHKHPIPGSACLLVRLPGGEWLPIHRVRPVSYMRA